MVRNRNTGSGNVGSQDVDVRNAIAFEASARGYFSATQDISSWVRGQMSDATMERGRTAGLSDHLFNAMANDTPYERLSTAARQIVTREEYAQAASLRQRFDAAENAFIDTYIPIATGYGYSESETREGGQLRDAGNNDSPLYQIRFRARQAATYEGEQLDNTYREAIRYAADRVDGFNGRLHNAISADRTMTAAEGYTPPESYATRESGREAFVQAGQNYITQAAEYSAAFNALNAEQRTTANEYFRALNAVTGDAERPAVPAGLEAYAQQAGEYLEATRVYRGTLRDVGYNQQQASEIISAAYAELRGAVNGGTSVPDTLDINGILERALPPQVGNAVNRAGLVAALESHQPVQTTVADEQPVQTTAADEQPVQTPPNADIREFQALAHALGHNPLYQNRPNVDGVAGNNTTQAIANARGANIQNFPAEGTDYAAMNAALSIELRTRLVGPPEVREPILQTFDAIGADNRISAAEGRYIDEMIEQIASARGITFTAEEDTRAERLARLQPEQSPRLTAQDFTGSRQTGAVVRGLRAAADLVATEEQGRQASRGNADQVLSGADRIRTADVDAQRAAEARAQAERDLQQRREQTIADQGTVRFGELPTRNNTLDNALRLVGTTQRRRDETIEYSGGEIRDDIEHVRDYLGDIGRGRVTFPAQGGTTVTMTHVNRGGDSMEDARYVYMVALAALNPGLDVTGPVPDGALIRPTQAQLEFTTRHLVSHPNSPFSPDARGNASFDAAEIPTFLNGSFEANGASFNNRDFLRQGLLAGAAPDTIDRTAPLPQGASAADRQALAAQVAQLDEAGLERLALQLGGQDRLNVTGFTAGVFQNDGRISPAEMDEINKIAVQLNSSGARINLGDDGKVSSVEEVRQVLSVAVERSAGTTQR